MTDLKISIIQSDLYWENIEANLAHFEEKIWAIQDDVEFRPADAEHGPWITGRGSHVFIRDEKIGEFGEIDPKVSGFFGIKSPIQAGEIDLEAIYRIVPDPLS